MPKLEPLVTNRTRSQALRIRELEREISQGIASEEEIEEFLSNRFEGLSCKDGTVYVSNGALQVLTGYDTWKGAYNYTDLNRVGWYMQHLRDLLYQCGIFPRITEKADWEEGDYNNAAALEYYLSDVQALRSAIAVSSETPEVPESLFQLTWDSANDIEQILLDVEELISNMMQAWYYAGDLYAGEV